MLVKLKIGYSLFPLHLFKNKPFTYIILQLNADAKKSPK